MNAPAMALPSVNTAAPTPPMTDPEEPVKVTDPAAPALRTSRFRGTVPSDWHITPEEDDKISAQNTRTQETFAGTIEEFNKLLRGR